MKATAITSMLRMQRILRIFSWAIEPMRSSGPTTPINNHAVGAAMASDRSGNDPFDPPHPQNGCYPCFNHRTVPVARQGATERTPG
jgi:hypothetical protein